MLLETVRVEVTKTLMQAKVRMPTLEEYIASQRAMEMKELHDLPEGMIREQDHADTLAGLNKNGPARNVMNPDDPSTWINTPRNAPCPCGSGKKYKHCHGQAG
jgi:preprotein translocase subunit SecA